MDMDQLINRLMTLPPSQLEAIYNHLWREAHNEIHPEHNHTLLAAIELVAGRRALAITGHGGAWEFKPQPA